MTTRSEPRLREKRTAREGAYSSFFIAEVGGDFEDRRGREARSPAAKAIADLFFELLVKDPEVVRALAPRKGECLVLALGFDAYLPGRVIRSTRIATDNLKKAVLRVAAEPPGIESRTQLLGGHDVEAGQISGLLVVLADLPSAQSYAVNASDENTESNAKFRRTRIKSLLEAEPPAYYDALVGHLGELESLVRQEVAARLQPVILQRVRLMRQETYAEKQEVARWVNGELRRLGLAVRCPVTGKPGTLVVDLGGAQETVSRFRVETRAEGHRTRKMLAYELTDFQLIDDAPRAASAARPADPKSR